MEVIHIKLFSMLGLGLGSLISGLLPLLVSFQSHSLFFSSLLCGGAGVLLATSLLHILPEVYEVQPKYSGLMFCSGFFMLYLLDEIVHCLFSKPNETKGRITQKYIKNQENRNEIDKKSSHCYFQENSTIKLQGSKSSCSHKCYNTFEASSSENIKEDNPDLIKFPSKLLESQRGNFKTEDMGTKQICELNTEAQLLSTTINENISSKQCSNVIINQLALLIALSVHSILEGMAVGLQTSNEKVLLLLGAIASHKLVVSFSLGMELRENQKLSCYIIYMTLFSLGSVFGIGFGLIIELNGSTETELAVTVLQAFAGGTLLYVTLSEVLPRERMKWQHTSSVKSAGIIQFTSVLIGFSAIAVIGLLIKENEGE